MKKCVSTSLFMHTPNKYNNSYLTLPISVKKYLPEFDLLIYHDDSVPSYMINEYKKYNFVRLIHKNKSVNRSGCFWR